MPAQKKIIYTISFITMLLALYCYNPFALYFQNDDFIHIPLSAQGKLLQQNTFRPICDLSIMLDYNLWHKNAWGYHLNNLLLHIIACVLFYNLLKLLFKKYTAITDYHFACWLSAVLFFIYAMHSEPVLWILGRSAILATIFSLSFLYCYIKRNDSSLFAVCALFFWVIGLLTYESAWILPCFCICISLVAIKQKETTLKKELAYLFSIVSIFIIYLVIRDHYIKELTGNYESGFLLNGDYALLLKHYILLFTRSFLPAFINNKLLITAFVILTSFITWLFIKRPKNKKPVTILLVCFLISLIPYTSLGVDTNGTESERFLYFPSLIVITIFAFIITPKKALWIFPCLFLIHIITLFIVKDNYRIAGEVNKQISAALKQTGNNKTVIVLDVPQAQNGAFILRQGLEGMIRWIGEKNPDTIITCSQRYELLPLQYPYKIIFSDTLSFKCANQKIIHAAKDTLLLKFTDSALIIGEVK